MSPAELRLEGGAVLCAHLSLRSRAEPVLTVLVGSHWGFSHKALFFRSTSHVAFTLLVQAQSRKPLGITTTLPVREGPRQQALPVGPGPVTQPSGA